MSNIGTVKIGWMHLGNTEIAKAYLGSNLVYQKKGVEPVVDYSKEYLTLTALGNSVTFSIVANEQDPNIPLVSYSTDGGSTWSTISPDTTASKIATLNSGQSVLLKGTQTGTSSTGYIKIDATGYYNASGNVMSLIFGDNFIGQTSLSGKDYAFLSLFHKSTNLKNVDNLVLPATTLATSCYQNMFRGTSITSTPKLPAMTLADSCYRQMFSQCSSLTEVPTRLPASNAPNYCYNTMFGACTSLKTAPDISATTVGAHCCEYMFYQCTSLENIPSLLPATTLADSCYKQMFDRCSALTTIPSTLLPATKLAHNCYKWMFEYCTSLNNIPSTLLPATTLADNCYTSMFYGCTALTEAPVLPATTLVLQCYDSMFYGCTRLKYIKAMFTSIPSINFTNSWVKGVSSSGTFVKNSAATWDVTGVNGVPTGWTVQTASS